ncbi:uncharacterized protein N7483_008996 [Penicillium malachiteum]|uniref:uncharacterized protein n=1 Tax=Penicillium malachiteum TaxID=1324776 RepID=UPI0025495592|nr:uncharacterized protein N7483_008996 [Penicillium malachiteum]KAJ5721062.1 hypothetical protein N7483_008996 [Penicillium malachiteum]
MNFIHIDLALGDCVAIGRGYNAVQGSVSFTDEDAQNCSVVLPGIQKHLARWWEIHNNIRAKSQFMVSTLYPLGQDDSAHNVLRGSTANALAD